jgi:hypothetical protein
MTYGRPPIEKIDLRSLERIEKCPPSRRSGSRMPTAGLDRWKAVREATVEWHRAGMPDDENAVADIEESFFGGWDAVQRRLLGELFAGYRRLVPREVTNIDLDPPFGVVIHGPTNRSINVAVQVDLEASEGWQAIRIKTGRAETSIEEAAAFYQPDEHRTLVDMRLAADDLVTIPSPEDPGGIVEDVATRWDRAQSNPSRYRFAGLHCYSCSRPARCGQYPILGEGLVTAATRTLLISKSRLARFGRCARSAAWPAIYGIPADDGDEDDLDPIRLVVGNQFHETVAAALLSDDPGALYEAAHGTVAPSEADDLRWLFDQHEAVWSTDDPSVSVRKTEYQFGVTFVVEGTVLDRRDQLEKADVAVTMLAVTDVNGWETEDIAAVVEHRTGGASTALPYESDLYAVSAWLALAGSQQQAEGVAVHFHHLRADPARCDREFYDAARIGEASARLRDVATQLADLHPADATSPTFTLGPWCERCDFASRCALHRT